MLATPRAFDRLALAGRLPYRGLASDSAAAMRLRRAYSTPL
jgi:hypothetical protein